MSDLNKMCVVDCGESVARYMSSDRNITKDDMCSVLIAATTAAVDDIYIDPILEEGSALQPVRASVMVSALCTKIREAMEGSMKALVHVAGEDQVVKAEARLEGNLVIVNFDLADEGD